MKTDILKSYISKGNPFYHKLLKEEGSRRGKYIQMSSHNV